MKAYYSFPELVQAVGKDYHAVRYAALTKGIARPAREFGKARLFSPEQVEALKEYFAKVEALKEYEKGAV